MTVLIHLVVSLGMLVIVPLGLTLMNLPGTTTVRHWWAVAAVPGAVSLWLPRNPLSITLASIYLAGTLALVALAAADLLRRKTLRAREIALYTALVTPSIAALALVAERASYELFGFKLTVLSLTVAHFHFAGFTAALTAVLLTISASVLVVTMLLAVSWALGHVVSTPYLPLQWMVATHGVANAVGFGLCGLLAWRRVRANEGIE